MNDEKFRGECLTVDSEFRNGWLHFTVGLPFGNFEEGELSEEEAQRLVEHLTKALQRNAQRTP